MAIVMVNNHEKRGGHLKADDVLETEGGKKGGWSGNQSRIVESRTRSVC